MSKVTNKNLPAYLEKMEAEVLELNYKSQSLKMSFNPDEFFCHSDGTILQGGFVTTMLDASMAFLIMQILEFKKVPLSIDINVNFLASGGPKLTIAEAKVIKIGKSIAFSSAELNPGSSDCLYVASSKNTFLFFFKPRTLAPKLALKLAIVLPEYDV